MEQLVENLKLYHRTVYDSSLRIRMTNVDELTVETESGRTYLYYDRDNTIRLLPKDSDNLSEDECRCEFGWRLREMMWRKNITQETLCGKTGISRATISSYSTGRSTPSFYNADKIAKALNCSLDDLRYY